MSTAKDLARAALAAFAGGDTGHAEDFIGADYGNAESSDRAKARGAQEFRDTVAWFHRSFADLAWEEQAILAEGDEVVVWGVMRGRHVAPFLGLAADNRPFAVEQVHLFRVKEDRLAVHRALRDDLRLLLTIGAKIAGADGAPLKVHHR